MCECCYRDLFLFFLLGLDCIFTLKGHHQLALNVPITGDGLYSAGGKVLAKVALNAVSHSVSPCTNRGDDNKPDWT